MKKTNCLLICLLASYSVTYSQALRKKGFVVLNNSDTLHGWVGFRPWTKGVDQVEFWKDSLSRTTYTYKLQDLRYFEVTGYDSYTRVILPPKTIRGYFTEPASDIQDPVTSDSVFLRLLIGGNRLSLWEYSNGSDLFFISEAIDSFELLANDLPADENSMPKFKAQLARYIQKYNLAGQLELPLTQSGYEEHDLSQLVKAINTPAGIVYMAPAIRKAIFSWFVGAGGGISKMTTPGDPYSLGTLRFGYHFMPVITAGVDYSSIKDLSKLMVRMQIAFSEAAYDGSATAPTSSLDQEYYHIQLWTISPSVSLLYHFTTRETNRIYAGAGFGYNYSFSPQNYFFETLPEQTIKNYIPLSKGWISGNLLLGIRLDHRWEIACNGQLFGSISQSPYALTPRTFLASVYCHIK